MDRTGGSTAPDGPSPVSPSERYRAAVEIARPQLGLVKTQQLIDAGWSRAAICGAAGAGRLEDAGTGLWALPGSPRTWEQRVAAAVYAIEGPVAAARTTALALHGVQRFHGRTPVHIVVPYGRSVARATPAVRVHRSRTLTPDDVVAVDGLPVTEVARSVCESAGSMNAQAVRWLLSEVIRAGVTTPADLRHQMHRLGPLRGSGTVRRELDRLDPQIGRARSGGEVRMLELAHEAEVPRPVLNHPIEDEDGRVLFEVDVASVALRLGFEHDGEAFHSTPDDLLKDRHRDNRLALDLDWDIYRFSERLVADHPRIVVRQMRAAVVRARARARPSETTSTTSPLTEL